MSQQLLAEWRRLANPITINDEDLADRFRRFSVEIQLDLGADPANREEFMRYALVYLGEALSGVGQVLRITPE